MNTTTMKTLGAGLLGVAALLFLGKSLSGGCQSTERYVLADADVKKAVSMRLAQAISENQDPGKVILVRFSGFIPATIKAQEIQVDSFRRGLKGRGWDVVELPPTDITEAAHGGWVIRTSGGDWGQDFREWLSPHADAVAVISLVGIPNLSPAQWRELPPFYAEVLSTDSYSEGLLERGLINGLVVMREDSDPIAIRTFRGSWEDLFDLAYEYRSASIKP